MTYRESLERKLVGGVLIYGFPVLDILSAHDIGAYAFADNVFFEAMDIAFSTPREGKTARAIIEAVKEGMRETDDLLKLEEAIEAVPMMTDNTREERTAYFDRIAASLAKEAGEVTL